MEHYFQTFFNYIAVIHDLPDADKANIRKYFKYVKKTKGSLVSKAGEIPTYHNFIVSGYLRNYHVNDKGEEITVDLNDGPRFFTSYFHFANQTISNENVVCLTDSELLQITLPEIGISAAESLTQQRYSVKLFHKLLAEKQEQVNDLAVLSAEERYLKLMKNRPNMIQNVPQKYIASYLGIKPESLSRIRKEIVNNKC